MKYLHIVPGANDVANGMARVARLLAKEQGDAEVVDLNRGKWGTGNGELGMGSGKREDRRIEGLEEVWVHGMWLPKEWAICRRVIKAGKRLVRMTHGSLSPVYLKQQGRWKKRLVGPIERYWLRKADRIVATCDAEKAWIEAYLGKKCPEIVVEDVKRFFKLGVRSEELGVSEDGFGSRVSGFELERDESNSQLTTHNSQLNLLYLGRRHPLKGVEYLEEAMAQLNNDPIIFVNPVQENSTRSTRLKIVSNAFGEELEKTWDWCDVLVLPTLSENFGLVVAEALERGKRVITTDGAPVWGEGVTRVDRVEGGGVFYGYNGRLLYLKGYRDGTDSKRVELLKDAIRLYLG